MSFVSAVRGQFAYFDRQLGRPDWRGKRVLDFGGNAGNILDDPACTIEQSLYWSIDVSREAIVRGEQLHPGGHFVFYDRKNPEFNPGGIEGLALPDLGAAFDFILALSVFTHTSRAEMIELVGGLRSMLGETGKLAFTILDPNHVKPESGMSNLQFFMHKYYDDFGILPSPEELICLDRAAGADLCTLVNELLYVDVEPASLPSPPLVGRTRFLTLCSHKLANTIFAGLEVIPPVEPFSRHSCCILDRM
jgi:hypothetical protein